MKNKTKRYNYSFKTHNQITMKLINFTHIKSHSIWGLKSESDVDELIVTIRRLEKQVSDLHELLTN